MKAGQAWEARREGEGRVGAVTVEEQGKGGSREPVEETKPLEQRSLQTKLGDGQGQPGSLLNRAAR